MQNQSPKITKRHDYRAADFSVDSLDLYFELGEQETIVKSRMQLVRQNSAVQNLTLDGHHLSLLSIHIDGARLTEDSYQVLDEQLIVFNVPSHFELAIETRIKPQENTALEGLYKASNLFCTQCEAHGFRRITYYLDRPDVMTRFKTTIVADRDRYPVLLSNGNRTKNGVMPNNRHFATWEDPFKKPCYLFALVAGDLAHIEDTFTTCSGRVVVLRIYAELGYENQCWHAMAALKQAMRWDEEVYGREYDLDIFMIVAVSDFNMGAMENKGLNIFNAKYILVDPKTATDADYTGVEIVVSHEYFHNWTGNRVTCRDWFQLSLKEGLTVFREQQFTAYVTSNAITRINSVKVIRSSQFAQDAGPLAHPVRPDSYIEMNNFYTVTVYNKGAEVIRMLHTLLGEHGFRKGMDLYFSRHDGQAVTVDDFVEAMADANGVDFRQFMLWYSQAGTPIVTVKTAYDETDKVYRLSLSQSCPPTPQQDKKQVMHIPLEIALLDSQGEEIQLPNDMPINQGKPLVLSLKETSQTWQFNNIPQKPVLSLLRNFSAPIKVIYERSDDELYFLLANDQDAFSCWDAGQQLLNRMILQLMQHYQQNQQMVMDLRLVQAIREMLAHPKLDKQLIALLILVPNEYTLSELLTEIDVDALVNARLFVRDQLAKSLQDDFLTAYQQLCDATPYAYEQLYVGKRSLKNTCLGYLMIASNDKHVKDLCLQQLLQSDNLTDQLAALSAFANADVPEREQVLNDFYQKWQHEKLVMDKWLAIQAGSELPDTLTRVQQLLKHPAFTYQNPNKIRSLIGTFGQANFKNFHSKDGQGYAFLAEQVLFLNSRNPQVAARMLEPLTRWQRFGEPRKALMKAQLEKVLTAKDLSKDVYEIAARSLQ